MIRQTSIEAYNHLVKNGVLSKTRRKVYAFLYRNAPITQKKVVRALNDRTSSIAPRFAELENMGLIRIVGKQKCEETGHQNMVWDVTDLVEPLKLEKKPKKKKVDTTVLVSKLKGLYNNQHDIFLKNDIAEIIEIAEAL